MPTTSFANPSANDGVVESDGFSGPAGTGLRLPGGLTAASQTTVYHTGDAAPPTATTGTDTTPATTTTYISRLYIPQNATLTGLALLNGSAVAGNVTLALYNSAGAVVAQTASTAQAGTAAYQKIPFTTPYAAKGPGQYFVAAQFNSTSARFRTHALGSFTTSTITGGTYGTFTTFTSPNSFTADVGPIGDCY